MFGTPIFGAHTDSLTDTDSAISDAPQTPSTPHTPPSPAGPSTRPRGPRAPANPHRAPGAPSGSRTGQTDGQNSAVGRDADSLHSNVCLWDTGLRFQPEADGQGHLFYELFYDDSAGVLHAVVGDLLYTYAVTSTALRRQGTVVHALGGAPAVKLVGMSPDWRLLALQRSSAHVEIMDSSTGNIIIQGPSHKRSVNVVLGFCWVTTPTVDFVLVTAAGLELYQRQEARAGHSLQLVDSKTHTVQWYKYSHETRVMLLSTGGSTGHCKLQAYQFNSRGILKLPSFEPVCAAVPGTTTLVNLYGRVYCCLVDKAKKRLLLYRFYRNTVLLQHQYALYDNSVALSSTDGLLLLHHRTARVTLVIDVCQQKPGPLGDPLPMTLQGAALEAHHDRYGDIRDPEGAPRGPRGAPVLVDPTDVKQKGKVTEQVNRQTDGQTNAAGALRPAYVDLGPPSGSAVEASFTGWMPSAATLYSTQWRFEQPNIILDVVQGIVYSVHVDLSALAACASMDLPMVLGVLQRRAYPTDPLLPRTLTIDLLRDALRRQTPLPVMLEAFSVLNTALKGALQAPQPGPHRGDAVLQQHMIPGAPVAVLTPQALHDEVLVWCVEQPDVDLRYIAAVVHAYMLSMVVSDIPSEPQISCFLVDTLLRRHEEYQVVQLCGSGCIPPSLQLAEHLLDLQEQGVTTQGHQLAVDVLQRHTPGAAQLPPDSDSSALQYVMNAVSEATRAMRGHGDRQRPLQLWLPAKDEHGHLNAPAVCAVRRQGVVSGRIPPLSLNQVLVESL